MFDLFLHHTDILIQTLYILRVRSYFFINSLELNLKFFTNWLYHSIFNTFRQILDLTVQIFDFLFCCFRQIDNRFGCLLWKSLKFFVYFIAFSIRMIFIGLHLFQYPLEGIMNFLPVLTCESYAVFIFHYFSINLFEFRRILFFICF